MSGATLAYHLRRNKYVERQIFMDLLLLYSRWREVRRFLYIGFGGVYFEEYKLLHERFGMKNMVSLEREKWMLDRQKHNLPYGCIDPLCAESGDLISDLEVYREVYDVKNVLIWLDFVTPSELPSQLNEVRSLISKLEDGDLLKITLSCHAKWLNSGSGSTELENRLENLRQRLGSTYLAEGITVSDVTNAGLPGVYIGALKRKIAEGLAENNDLEFQPLGCYTYNDGTPMLTVTGALISRDQAGKFSDVLNLKGVDFTSPDWSVHEISVPDLSLRERLEIDRKLDGRSAETVAAELGFRFEEDVEDSVELIRNYIKLHRFYPNFHRVQV